MSPVRAQAAGCLGRPRVMCLCQGAGPHRGSSLLAPSVLSPTKSRLATAYGSLGGGVTAWRWSGIPRSMVASCCWAAVLGAASSLQARRRNQRLSVISSDSPYLTPRTGCASMQRRLLRPLCSPASKTSGPRHSTTSKHCSHPRESLQRPRSGLPHGRMCEPEKAESASPGRRLRR